jgi:excisionase family DNA binding protein
MANKRHDFAATDNSASAEAVLTDKEAADLLKCSRSHFRNMNRLGQCPAPVKFGRSSRWRYDELIDWLHAGCPPRHRWHWDGDKSSR